jgi:nucleoside-diphosphate-sugar epimerase
VADKHKVALIGGAGFIGHHLALKLSRQGHQVEVVDSLEVNHLTHYAAQPPSFPNRDLYIKMLLERIDLINQAGIPLHAVDARDYNRMSLTLSRMQPDVIVHLAAISHAGKSNKDPLSTFDHSLRTLENALDYARDSGVHLVYFSSSMVYGNFQTDPVEEDHPLEPIGIYGALKVAGEKMVIAYHQVFEMPYTIIRPSALYGPRCVSRRVGQVFIENALERETLRVDGKGEEKVDFTYVGDLVDGVIAAIESPVARNETFNMTAGRGRTLAELVSFVQRRFPEIEVEYVERDALRPYRGGLSIEKARRLLGYDGKTPLEQGLDEYIDWYHQLVAQELPRPS